MRQARQCRACWFFGGRLAARRSRSRRAAFRLHTPWYVPQPHGAPLDLTLPDSEIWTQTEAICRADPGFQPLNEWQARFGQH